MDNTELQTMPENSQDVVVGINPKQLKAMIKAETEMREMLMKFIADHLKEGKDYGKIHVVGWKNCQLQNDCTNEKHFSKPSLFKGGTEKFTSLFKLRPTFRKDDDTLEMAGSSKDGLFCYVCELMTQNGMIVAEGRGACHISEKKSANEAIKLAQKRAQTDAVLRQGALSDFFTQDVEDMNFNDRSAPAPRATPPKHPVQNTGPSKPKWQIEQDQEKVEIAELCKILFKGKLETTDDYKQVVHDITGIELMPKNYKAVIKALKDKKEIAFPAKTREQTKTEEVQKEVSKEQLENFATALGGEIEPKSEAGKRMKEGLEKAKYKETIH